MVAWPTLQPIQHLETSLGMIDRIAIHPDAKSIIVAGGVPAEGGQWECWSWPQLNRYSLDEAHSDVISDFDFDRSGDLVTSSFDGDIRTHSKNPRALTGHSKSVLALRILPKSSYAVSAGRDQSIRVWDLADGNLLRSLNQHTGEINTLAVRPALPSESSQLPMIASGGADRTIRFWQPTIGRMVRFLRCPSSPLDLVWNDEGNHVIAAFDDGRVRMIHADTLKVVAEVEVSTGWLYTIAIAPTSDQSSIDAVEVAVGTESGEVKRITLPYTSEQQ